MAMDMKLVKKVVKYFNKNHSTTRATAKHFGLSNRTVHKYLTEIMPNETSAAILKTNRLASPYLAGVARQAKAKEEKAKGNGK